jgi:hypothetical protein
MSFIDKMKKAGKSVVDAGAKTMLKVRPRQCVCVCASVLERLAATPGLHNGHGLLRSDSVSPSTCFAFGVFVRFNVELHAVHRIRTSQRPNDSVPFVVMDIIH